MIGAVAAVLGWAVFVTGMLVGWWTPRQGPAPVVMGGAAGLCGGIGIVQLIFGGSW